MNSSIETDPDTDLRTLFSIFVFCLLDLVMIARLGFEMIHYILVFVLTTTTDIMMNTDYCI